MICRWDQLYPSGLTREGRFSDRLGNEMLAQGWFAGALYWGVWRYDQDFTVMSDKISPHRHPVDKKNGTLSVLAT
jgi:hypothetical protein